MVCGVVLCLTVINCSGDSVSDPRFSPGLSPRPTPVPPFIPAGSIRILSLTTYEGSGQAVHPDFVTTPAGWGDGQSHLAVTPYPNGQAAFENPSIYIGHSLTAWTVPDGIENPIARPGTSGYLSDPAQVYNSDTQELWLYYRQVATVNQILLIRSSDGIQWSTPETLITVPNQSAISPTVVRRSAGDWWMWTVNGGKEGCSSPSATVELRQSADGITWSAPQTVPLGDDTQFPWHVDVIWVAQREEFWALYNAKTAGSCTTRNLYFATSPDGIHWTTAPTPLLQHGAIPEFADIVYRSALSYDATTDGVTVFYSGAQYKTGSYIWRVGVQQLSRTQLFDFVLQQNSSAPSLAGDVPLADRISARSIAPPLTDETAP